MEKFVDVLFVVVQCPFPNLLSLFQCKKFVGSFSQSRSSQTIFIRIIYTLQFVKTVGPEDVFGFAEIRISNFWINKKGNSLLYAVNSQSWQGHKDLNCHKSPLSLTIVNHVVSKQQVFQTFIPQI